MKKFKLNEETYDVIMTIIIVVLLFGFFTAITLFYKL